MVLDEVDGVVHGPLVGLFDLLHHLSWRDRPQGGDGFDGGEGQVVSGDAGLLGAADSGEIAREFAIVGRVSAVLGTEHFPRQSGPELCPHLVGDGCVPSLAALNVVVTEPLCQLHTELGFLSVDREQGTEFGGLCCHFRRRTSFDVRLLDLVGVGVPAFAEERFHLFGGDHRVRFDRPGCGVFERAPCPTCRQASQARSQPATGRLALGAVVVRERHVALVGGIHRGDLTGQVLVAGPGRELVHGHRHAPTVEAIWQR